MSSTFDLMGGDEYGGSSPFDVVQTQYKITARKVAEWPQTVLTVLIVALILILWLWFSRHTAVSKFESGAQNPTSTSYLQTMEGPAPAAQAVPGAHLPQTAAETVQEFSCRAGRAPRPATYQPWSWAYGDRGTVGDEIDPFAEENPGISSVMTQDAWEAALANYKAAHPEKTLTQAIHAVNQHQKFM